MPHERSREPIQRSGVTASSSPSMTIVPSHEPHLREPLRVQHLAERPGPHHVRLLLDDREQPPPVEVHGDALGLLEDDAQLLQRLGDLDPVVADALVEAVVVEGVAEVHGGLLVSAADEDEGVLGAEVGVVAERR